jgi:hypothetical protein
MVTKQEAQRIAAAVNLLRPDWRTALIMTVLGDERNINRPYADLAIAMTAVAVDPASKKPGRIHENGIWWNSALASTPIKMPRYPSPTDCGVCGRPFELHSSLSAVDDHEYETQRAKGVGPTPEQKAAIRAARLEAEKLRTAAREDKPKREPRDPADVIAEHAKESP